MFQVRFHGRGGQGSVTAAELLSVAAFLEGKHALAFPSFGPERSGAPVLAFCRIDDKPIRTHEPIVDPDAIVVQDATLFGAVDVLSGLHADGFVLVNTREPVATLGLGDRLHGRTARTVAASDIARAALGKPLPNAALLGALAALTAIVDLPPLVAAIEKRFKGAAGAANVAAARAAWDAIKEAR